MNTPDLQAELKSMQDDALARIAAADSADVLEEIRLAYLGKKGTLKGVLRSLGKLPPEERSKVGALANKVKEAIQERLTEAKDGLGASAGKTRKGAPQFDVTMPGRTPQVGTRHPIHQVAQRMLHIFHNLGFSVADGPEVEDEWHNFIGLNIPPDHIARDPSENFYLEDDELLLRSQTSTVQIRVMENNEPPLRIVAPGKVYRPDTVDASHHYMFHQIEGLMVDEGVSLRDLKSTLLLFFRQLYGPKVNVRLRPSFFPFTEPSAEIDMSCPFCESGCKVCGGKGWIEMGGCGMVDPNVFEAVGYDPEKYTGFAFGMGIDRLTMSFYDIHDIRYLTENDTRFLEQFRA